MGHVPPEPEHDADGRTRHAEALTGRQMRGTGRLRPAAILLVAGLAALGDWQIHRRAWKLDLIARVEARIHAAPTARRPIRETGPAVGHG